MERPASAGHGGGWAPEDLDPAMERSFRGHEGPCGRPLLRNDGARAVPAVLFLRLA